MRCASSASPCTGPDKNAALNIWNVTPEEAMLTPRSSRISPNSLPDANIRNDSLKLSATLEKSTEFQYRTDQRENAAEPSAPVAGNCRVWRAGLPRVPASPGIARL